MNNITLFFWSRNWNWSRKAVSDLTLPATDSSWNHLSFAISGPRSKTFLFHSIYTQAQLLDERIVVIKFCFRRNLRTVILKIGLLVNRSGIVRIAETNYNAKERFVKKLTLRIQVTMKLNKMVTPLFPLNHNFFLMLISININQAAELLSKT